MSTTQWVLGIIFLLIMAWAAFLHVFRNSKWLKSLCQGILKKYFGGYGSEMPKEKPLNQKPRRRTHWRKPQTSRTSNPQSEKSHGGNTVVRIQTPNGQTETIVGRIVNAVKPKPRSNNQNRRRR